MAEPNQLNFRCHRTPRKIKVASRRKPPRGLVSVTINVTYACNLTCRNCLQLCDVWRQPCSEVTMEQVEKFISDAARLPLYFVRISGGEPTLHPQFREIMDLLDQRLIQTGLAWYGGVDTNSPEGSIELPPYWTQIGFPDKARHNVQLISPDEVGMRSPDCGTFCRIQNRCGIGFDHLGWSFCLLASNLQAMLRIDKAYDQPQRELDAGVCKHCVWSLSRSQMRQLNEDVAAGRVPWPSSVFSDSLETLGDQEAIERTRRFYQLSAGKGAKDGGR